MQRISLYVQIQFKSILFLILISGALNEYKQFCLQITYLVIYFRGVLVRDVIIGIDEIHNVDISLPTVLNYISHMILDLDLSAD